MLKAATYVPLRIGSEPSHGLRAVGAVRFPRIFFFTGAGETCPGQTTSVNAYNILLLCLCAPKGRTNTAKSEKVRC